MVRVCGVDPGAQGAFVVVEDGQIVEMHDMPMHFEHMSNGTRRQRVNLDALVVLLKDLTSRDLDLVVIERIGPRPGESPVAVAGFVEGAALIRGVFAAFGARIVMAWPSAWKGDMGVTANKRDCIAAALRLWPNWSHMFRRLKDSGRAESALLALYGAKHFVGDTP